MATLGSLIVNVLANTSGFAKGMKEVQTGIGNIEKAANKLDQALGVIGLGFSAYAIVGQLRATADEIDNLAKLSDRLGITTEALRGLQYGAGLAGVSSESLSDSLQFMTKQIGEAVHGSGKAKVVFHEMGISLEYLKRLAPEVQLMTLAEELNGMADEAERARAALRLFGGDGAGMLNFLAEGQSGIRKYLEEAKKLGLTYTREEAAKVEAFNDAWEKLANTLGGISKDITISIAPKSLDAVNAFQETVEALNQKSGRDGKTFWEREFQMTNRIIGAIGEMVNYATEDLVKQDVKELTKIRFAPEPPSKSWTGILGNGGTPSPGWGGTPTGMLDDFDPNFGEAPPILNIGLYARRLSKAIGSQPEKLSSAFSSMSRAVDTAKQFGKAWQGQWLLGKFVPGQHDTAINELFSKRQTEQQVKGLKFMSDKLGLTGIFGRAQRWISGMAEQNRFALGGGGTNSAIVYGSVEYARAKADDRARERMLTESKKHTSLLSVIAQALKPFSTDV